MRGTVLGYDETSGRGVIRDETGARFELYANQWRGPGPIPIGGAVDFMVNGTQAVDVYPLPAASSGGFSGQQVRAAAGQAGNWFSRYILKFDDHVGPALIKIVYYITLVLLLIGGIFSLVGAFGSFDYGVAYAFGMMIASILVVLLGALVLRMMAELALIQFKIHDRLSEIRDQTRPG